jgi:hypothetical protein
MATSDLVPSSDAGGGSALKDFLSHTTIYEKAGAVLPRDLVQFGLLGSGAVILGGLVALLLPDPNSIRMGGFFLVLGPMEAGLAGFMHALAVPAIVCGLLLLGLDVYLTRVPTNEHWRWAVVGQAAAGGVGGGLGVLFLALALLNLAIWIAIICACVALGLMLIGVLASGG